MNLEVQLQPRCRTQAKYATHNFPHSAGCLENPPQMFHRFLKKAKLKIISLAAEHLTVTSQLLSRAFLNDPITHYIFNGSISADDPRLLAFHRFSCIIRLDMNWPLIGVEKSQKLVAVASLTEPGEVQWPDTLRQAFADLRSCIGEEAASRLQTFAQIAEASRPDVPHIYLGFIGTDPRKQGKGYGRALLDWIHEYSESHPISHGVALDTENAANVPIYEHFGYRVTNKHSIGELSVWCMFRTNSAKKV